MTNPTRDFRDLVVWQRAQVLLRLAYLAAARLPADERFGLTSQIRRAAASVPANIAEGHSRRHRGEFVQFLYVARASLKELENHVLGCETVGYLDRNEVEAVLEASAVVGRMLNAMLGKLATIPADTRHTLHATRTDVPSSHASARRNRSQS